MTPMRRPRRQHLIRVAAFTLLMLLSFGGIRGSMAAFTDQTTNPGNATASLTLGATASVTATAPATSAVDSLCKANNIDIAWNAVTNADSYRVQVSVDGGAWTDVNGETGNVLTIPDPNSYQTNQSVQYRVYARINAPNWESSTPVTSNTLQCGVVDLAAVQLCSNDVRLDWTGGAGSNRWDIQYSANGGAWTSVANNQNLGAGPNYTYTAATNFTDGDDVRYQVRPGYSTTADYGSWSNSTAQLVDTGLLNWQNFRVRSVAVANSGLLGTLNAGDTIVITFSKPVSTGTVTISSMRTRTGTNRLYLAATTNVDYQIGAVTTGAIFGTTANYAGTLAWSAGNTVLTWTSSGAGTTMSADLSTSTAWTRSTTVKCNDGATSITTTMPAYSGRW